MNKSTVMPAPYLVCPTCKQALQPHRIDQQQFLLCCQCAGLTPVINGFVLFNETDMAGESLRLRVTALSEKFNDDQDYQHYRETKQQRNIIEIYATFQPFNESSRAIYPFIDRLQQQLKPNDLIIDTWARTGWSTLLLAALFPEQHIVGLWETDNSVLGYAGYSHWFAPERCPSNVSILFLAPEQDLPFNDASVALIHGHDILHRRAFPHYIDDLLRVGNAAATILLPHIHLSNSEPDPFFQRGGEYRHGGDYDRYLQQQLQHDRRSGLVLSEPQLFEQQRPLRLIDGANGGDYNGMIVIAEQEVFAAELTEEWLQQPSDYARIISNPLLQVCPLTGDVYLNQRGLGDQLNYLLQRHPIYQKRLQQVSDVRLSRQQIELLQFADNGDTLADIGNKLALSVDTIKPALLELAKVEIITLLPVSAVAVELQNFHSNQHSIIDNSFSLCWSRLLLNQPHKIIATLEGEALTVKELTQLIDGWRRYLQRCSDIKMLRLNTKNTLMLPLVLACWLEHIKVSQRPIVGDAELTLASTIAGKPPQKIHFKEDTDNNYWALLEPFIEEDSLPLVKINTPNLGVDDIPWWQWLLPMIHV